MESYRPMQPALGPAAQPAQRTLPLDASPSMPRPDLPPVSPTPKTEPTAPRPPSLTQLGVVRERLLEAPSGAAPQALKPWGTAILPDAERAEERRVELAEMQKSEEASAGEAAPEDTQALATSATTQESERAPETEPPASQSDEVRETEDG